MYEEFIKQIHMSFHLILKVPSKEDIGIPVFGWRKLSLGLVSDFPQVNWIVCFGDKWLEPGAPWLQIWLSFCLSYK